MTRSVYFTYSNDTMVTVDLTTGAVIDQYPGYRIIGATSANTRSTDYLVSYDAVMLYQSTARPSHRW